MCLAFLCRKHFRFFSLINQLEREGERERLREGEGRRGWERRERKSSSSSEFLLGGSDYFYFSSTLAEMSFEIFVFVLNISNCNRDITNGRKECDIARLLISEMILFLENTRSVSARCTERDAKRCKKMRE